jgi:heterogeneous nuclear rnp K-like protein 2
MPDADSNRKRSRSPSDGEQHKTKRANTGAANPSDDARVSNSATAAPDINMSDALAVTNDDNLSTSSPNHSENLREEGSGDSKSTSTVGNGDKSGSATTSAAPSLSTAPGAASPPTAQINMRCLIVTQDASIIIGRAGAHVNEIREKSGARVVVSESIPGNPERILNVSGPLDAVSKVWYFVSNYMREFTCVSRGFWSYRTSY